MASGPSTIRWTEHAAAKAVLLGLAMSDVAADVLERHALRRRNVGAAEWRVEVGRLVIVYGYPDGDDLTCARIVTLWRRR